MGVLSVDQINDRSEQYHQRQAADQAAVEQQQRQVASESMWKGIKAVAVRTQMEGTVRTQLEGTVSEEVQDSIKAGLVRTQMDGAARSDTGARSVSPAVAVDRLLILLLVAASNSRQVFLRHNARF